MAAMIASDPIRNIPQLPALQSALQAGDSSHYQLERLNPYMACVLPSTVKIDADCNTQLDARALQTKVAAAHASGAALGTQGREHPGSAQQEQYAEQGRVGLATLLLGVWAQRLQDWLQLQARQTSGAAKGIVRTPSLPDDDAIARSAAAAQATQQQATAEQQPCNCSSDPTISSAEVSHPVPDLACWADHMSMMTSDADEEEAELMVAADSMVPRLTRCAVHICALKRWTITETCCVITSGCIWCVVQLSIQSSWHQELTVSSVVQMSIFNALEALRLSTQLLSHRIFVIVLQLASFHA